MPNLLLSGPAGGGKSQEALRLLEEMQSPRVRADFQSLYVALTGVERDSSGRYPLRDPALVPVVDAVRFAAIAAAVRRGIEVVATNSSGDPSRRRLLLDSLGPNATERIIDPGPAVVAARLADPITGTVSVECGQATGRWYNYR